MKEKAIETENAPGLLSQTDSFYEVVLDQTLFFPEEGGQTCDSGVLMVGFSLILPVLDVQIQEGFSSDGQKAEESSDHSSNEGHTYEARICHVLTQELDVGTMVHGIINFDHRFSNMQNHSGEHIFSGLVHKHYGYENVGFHLSDNEVTMDYNGKLTGEEIEKLEIEANDWIRQNVQIDCRYPDPEELEKMDYRSKKELSGPVRIVTIPGCDVCACCAPHVRTTAEVGILKVISFMNYKGGVRLSILCGERAEADYRARQEELDRISRLLKVPALACAERVDKLLEEKTALQAALNEAEGRLLENEIQRIPASEKNPLLFTKIQAPNLVRRSVNLMTSGHSGISAIFFPKDGPAEDENTASDYSYIIGSGADQKDLRDLQKKLNQAFQARGGGKSVMIQGSLRASARELRDFWKEL
ncbi:MAG: alanyl-tRNA editing protein [Lachnospiraceae bacterium]|nr:alanyl-tRNA editing protein [Lachnospiraceae bacterium]